MFDSRSRSEHPTGTGAAPAVGVHPGRRDAPGADRSPASPSDDASPAEPLDSLPATQLPDAGLAALLDAVDLTQTTDFTLVEVVAAWQRVASWAAAQAAAAAAELAGRDSMNPAWPASAGPVQQRCVAADELAMRLSCSRRAAGLLVRDGLAFAGPLAWTGEALARGEIDAVKARMIADRLDGASMEVALAVQDAVLTDARTRTPTQLGRDLTRALIEVDPVDAALRHERAVTTRHVDRPRLLPDGMAGLWAVLPAQEAARVDAILDVAARSARATGDPRTLDQLRADLLVDLTTTSAPGSGSADSAARTGTRVPATPPRPHRPVAQIRVTVSAATLMGLDDQPGELDGYGAITAFQARALAAGGVWRRLVTDPLSGTVLDVGRARYRPPADLAELVVARDRHCAAPGCSARAESCDLDHTIEFHRPAADGTCGTTAAHNLGPLCRRHHQIKTDAGFRLSQPTPGTFDWTSSTGHRYRVTPGTLPPPLQPPPAPGAAADAISWPPADPGQEVGPHTFGSAPEPDRLPVPRVRRGDPPAGDADAGEEPP